MSTFRGEYPSELEFLVTEYGGWGKLMNPATVVPELFFVELEKWGYNRRYFAAMRAAYATPERERCLAYIAFLIHRTRIQPNVAVYGRMLEGAQPRIVRFQITDEEIEREVQRVPTWDR